MRVKANEELYGRILKAVPEGVWVVDPQGRTIFCNTRMAALLGTDVQTMEDLNCFDPLFPDDVEEAKRHFAAQLAGGPPFDFRLRRMDGSPVWVMISCMPMMDPSGATTGLIGLFTDIGERRRAEEAVRQSEERFRKIADAAPVMIWMSGPDKRCNFVNKQWLEFSGRTFQQEIGDGWADGIHPEDRNRCMAAYFSSFDARRTCRMEYRFRRADGEYRWILDNGAPLYDGTEFAGYIGSCIDVTDFKRTQQTLHEYREQLRQLTVSLIRSQEDATRALARELHDVFSQELVAIGMQIHLLKSEVAPDKKLARRLSEIVVRLDQLATDVHRTSRELHPMILEELGLEPALRQECQAFQARFGIRTSFTAKSAPPALAKEGRLCLYRVAQESLRNIGKHATDARGVRVSLTGDPQGATLVITDTGSGFEIEAARKKGGLGLISMEERVRSVKGDLTIRSTRTKGTTVQVFVPKGSD
jgi:PAS domain S-box-containing protein